MKQGSQIFTTGINRRIAQDRASADSFYTLQNVRLQKRGDTGYIQPIAGYEEKSAITFTALVAISRHNNSILLLDALGGGNFTFRIVETTTYTATATFSYTGDTAADEYRILVFGNTVFVSPHNKQFTLIGGTWRMSDFVSTTPTFTVANSSSTGNLEVEQFYWYRVRYVYRDGHTTRTSYPKGLETNSNGSVDLVINTTDDIDGNKADIEIFRSTNGEPFVFIGREKTSGSSATFTDNGKPSLDAYNEEIYVWPNGYTSHEQVRDRYVRANIDFLSSEILPTIDNSAPDVNDGIYAKIVSTTASDGDFVAPRNALVDIYCRYRFTDGTESFHYKVLTAGSTSESADNTINFAVTNYSAADLGTDRAVKEVAFYANYLPKQRPSTAIHAFDTIEVYNTNIPSIRSSNPKASGHYLEELAEERPTQTRIWFGWKQICAMYDTSHFIRVFDSEWDYDCADPSINEQDKEKFNIDGTVYVTAFTGSLTEDPGTIVAGGSRTVVVTCTGARVGDTAAVPSYTGGTFQTDGGVFTLVPAESGDDFVTVTYSNPTGVDITPGTGTINVTSTPNLRQLSNPPAYMYLDQTIEDTGGFTFREKNHAENTATIIPTEKRLFKKYTHKYSKTTGTYSHVYELAVVESLKEAVRKGLLYIRLNESNVDLSSKYSNQRYQNEWVKVVGVEDTSESYKEYKTVGNFVFSAPQNHLYFVVETGSIYDDIDNNQINRDKRNDNSSTSNFGIVADYDVYTAATYIAPTPPAVLNNTGIYDPKVTFEIATIVDQSTDDEGSPASEDLGSNINQYYYDLSYYSPSSVPDQFNNLVYLGSVTASDTATKSPTNTGFIKRDRNNLIHTELASNAIYETLVRAEDVKTIEYDFPNQIVWSESFISNTDASQIRNFPPNNFYNISSQHGAIKTIRAKGNVLYVFCETGVAALAIGEVLTQQTDQTVKVDSSSLLNSEVWVFRNLNNIAPRSVVLFENNLFFYDGTDVWMHTDNWQNITNGIIGEFTPGTIVRATFDPYNKEYRIGDGLITFAYSIETTIWTGPHTYVEDQGTSIGDDFYTTRAGKMRLNNTGTTFAGAAISTVIESVANTIQDFSVTKMWRKFYVDADGTFTFKYTKDLVTSFFTARSSDRRSINGVTEFGVTEDYRNSRMLRWRLESTSSTFKLKGLHFEFLPKLRR